MISIINYGVGNLASIQNMFKKIGVPVSVATHAADLNGASKIILPGIGAFDHCMRMFNASSLREPVTRKVKEEKMPLLGICVGLQMLMEGSEEGNEPGLGWISGKTVRFRKESMGKLKIPHMGWTDITVSRKSELTKDLGDQPRFYFVHSYHVKPDQPEDELITAEYGYPFVAGVNRENIYGVQFHPEKSHRFGMRILENFSRL